MRNKIVKMFVLWFLGVVAYMLLIPLLLIPVSILFKSYSIQVGGIGLMYGTWVFILLHFVFSILYLKERQVLFKRILIGLLITYGIILLIPWSVCSTDSITSNKVTSCSCIGDVKIGILATECVGVRTQCFYHRDANTKMGDPGYPEKVECN